jgi:DNA-binding IclR family transcriptional regulator
MSTPKNQSVVKAFAMLSAFERPDEWLSSAEISRRANIPESSGYRMMETLTEIGAVVRGSRGRYRPGMLLVSLSNKVAIDDLLSVVSRPILRELCSHLDSTAHIAILEDDMIKYVAKMGESRGVNVYSRVGTKLEAYCTALGKILLAALPPDALESYILGGDFVPLTPLTITNPADLRVELDRVKQSGYALDAQESSQHLICLAVPIRGADGSIVAAMSVTESAQGMTKDRQREVRSSLLSAADMITSRIFPSQEAPAIALHS